MTLVLSGDSPSFSGTYQGGTITSRTMQTAPFPAPNNYVDFLNIPSWVKRITVMLNGVRTSGTSSPIIQLGSGSTDTSGYLGACLSMASAGNGGANNSVGFILGTALTAAATSVRHGAIILTNVSANIWVVQGNLGSSEAAYLASVGGSKSLSGTLDRIRLTTVNGTDTFEAGSVNILYEG